MSAIPVTIHYGTVPIIDEQHTIGRYCYGHPGENFDFTDSNPTGLIWRTGYSSDNFGGLKYYIVSRANVESVGSEPTIPTYHVTGRTNPEILHLINRLHSIKEDSVFYTDVNLAKRYVVDDQNLNHFLADLSNYKYWNSTKLRMNFDFGNLNCDILEDNLTKCYDLCQRSDGVIERWLVKETSANMPYHQINGNNFATSYRIFNSTSSYIVLDSISPVNYVTPLNTQSLESFMFAMRFNFVPTPGQTVNLMYANGGLIKLRYDDSTDELVFAISSDTTSIPLQPGIWTTIIFGRDNSGNLFITDGIDQSIVGQALPQEMIFDNGFYLGTYGNLGELKLGSFQYWKGANYDTNKWNGVNYYQMLSKWS